VLCVAARAACQDDEFGVAQEHGQAAVLQRLSDSSHDDVQRGAIAVRAHRERQSVLLERLRRPQPYRFPESG
jgi:hypothetical protein